MALDPPITYEFSFPLTPWLRKAIL